MPPRPPVNRGKQHTYDKQDTHHYPGYFEDVDQSAQRLGIDGCHYRHSSSVAEISRRDKHSPAGRAELSLGMKPSPRQYCAENDYPNE